MTGVEHGHTFVNGLFNDVVGISGNLLGCGEQYCVNHVNDSVGSLDVGLDHLGFVDHQGFAGRLDRNFRTIDGFGGIELGGFLRLNLAWYDMIGEDINEFLLVFRFEKSFDGAFGQLGKSVVGWGENRERTFTLKGIDQAGCFNGGHEGLEAPCLDRGVDDVFLWCSRKYGSEH
mgnify:CR=1 FL=1